jgi:hypothetical protein
VDTSTLSVHESELAPRAVKKIFEESILGEIANVVSDATKCNGYLQYRGHVVAISLMCGDQ